MMFLPCVPWITADQIAADPRVCPEGSGDPTPDFDPYVTRATEALWVLTGRRFGVCSATVRPLRRGCGCGCGCGGGITLHSPLVSVDGVTIDGEPFTSFYVRDGRAIYRSDHAEWPASQDLGLPTSAPGTFSITYTYGVEPPEVVKKGTLELAVQYVLLDRESSMCQLPMGTTRATYQGLTVDMERALESSNRLVADAVNSYPMGAGAPPDAWHHSPWELAIVSA